MLVSNSKSVIISKVAEVFDLVYSTFGVAQANEAERALGDYWSMFCLFCDKAFNVAQHLDLQLCRDAFQIGVDMLNGTHCVLFDTKVSFWR